MPAARRACIRATPVSNLDRLLHRAPERPDAATDRQLAIFARRISLLGLTAAWLLFLGAVGLALSEHVTLWYGFRWALDTAATVGGFPQPRTIGGQIVNVLLIVLGVGTLFYALATVTEFFVAGHVGDLLAARRMQKMIDSLSDHHIICGFGRVGRQVERDLRAARARYVVVDADSRNRARAEGLGVSFIEGDAADDVVLMRAGIERARSIIACADSDADNVFITLTARELRADIPIVARAAIEDTEKKLKRAGADRVISPYKASGTEMARLALHPQLSGVFDVDAEYRMEEIPVGDGCQGVGQTVGDIRGGSMIVGLRRGADFHPQPPAETALSSGDVILAMGTPSTLERLEELLAAARRRA
jgi:voltage-gated potassium channel